LQHRCRQRVCPCRVCGQLVQRRHCGRCDLQYAAYVSQLTLPWT
jgi:hypothetical protein